MFPSFLKGNFYNLKKYFSECYLPWMPKKSLFNDVKTASGWDDHIPGILDDHPVARCGSVIIILSGSARRVFGIRVLALF